MTPDGLRHTFLAFLVRQGVRFTELARIAGPLPADRLAAYRQLRGADREPSTGGIVRVLPAIAAYAE